MTKVSIPFIIRDMETFDAIEFGKRLRAARVKKGLSQQDLADLFGIERASVSMWERGKNPPALNKIGALARKLEVSGDWLISGVRDQKIPEVPSNIIPFPSDGALKFIPLVSWPPPARRREFTDSGESLAAESSTDEESEERILVTVNVGKNAFVAQVKGDSMAPEYPDGSVIIVDPAQEPRHNADVVVRLNEEAEPVFKRLKIDGSRWYLFPLNERYPTIPLEGKDFTICGVVIWMGRKVKDV